MHDANQPRDEQDPQAVITVRLPAVTHASLKRLAHERYKSLNQLCVEQLERMLAPDPATSDPD